MIRIHYYGHSSFLLEADEAKILFDPFISGNEKAKDIRIESLDCQYICVSHGHGDHMEDVIAIAQRTAAKVIAPYEISEWFIRHGVTNTQPMNIGGTVKAGSVSVKMTSAVHSSVLPDGTYGGPAAGYLLKTAANTLYYAGDTALHYDMKLLGEFEKVDVALLPIGDIYTMGPEDAARAAEFVGAKKVIGMHYDTFPPITIDRQKAVNTFKDKGIELVLMDIGQTYKLG